MLYFILQDKPPFDLVNLSYFWKRKEYDDKIDSGEILITRLAFAKT